MSQSSEHQPVTRRSGIPQIGPLQPQLKPWKRVDWPLCTQAGIFRDWAMHMTNKQTLHYLDRSLAICNTQDRNTCCLRKETNPTGQNCKRIDGYFCQMSPDTLYRRSKCRRAIGQPELALQDAEQAYDLLKLQGISKVDIMLNKCDALFECNNFEDTLVMLHQEMRDFARPLSKDIFKMRVSQTINVLSDVLDDSLHFFALDNWPLIAEARSHPTAAFIPQPLWQQLAANMNCDVESVDSAKKIKLSPLERARRRVHKNIYNYNYLQSSAKDMDMLHLLKDNIKFTHLEAHESYDFMSDLLSEQIGVLHKFMKMSHSRSPLYHRKYRRSQARTKGEVNQMKALYRVEYQTRRDCYRMLREVHSLRREGRIEQLTNYVEHIMSTCITLKTHRTLPWKWQFVNEVYNILAMAHIDRCRLPKNLEHIDLKNHSVLYWLPTERAKDLHVSTSFGGRNPYADIDKENERQIRVAKKLEGLHERLHFSRYPIERAYLHFEIGRLHFKESNHEKTMLMAQRALAEARKCNSLVWRFNITFLVCQVHAVLNRYARLGEVLNNARKLADRLGSVKLQGYIELCKAVNDYELDHLRKGKVEGNSLRRKRSGYYSNNSLQSLS